MVMKDPNFILFLLQVTFITAGGDYYNLPQSWFLEASIHAFVGSTNLEFLLNLKKNLVG
jgi:hypothetical protein